MRIKITEEDINKEYNRGDQDLGALDLGETFVFLFEG